MALRRAYTYTEARALKRGHLSVQSVLDVVFAYKVDMHHLPSLGRPAA